MKKLGTSLIVLIFILSGCSINIKNVNTNLSENQPTTSPQIISGEKELDQQTSTDDTKAEQDIAPKIYNEDKNSEIKEEKIDDSIPKPVIEEPVVIIDTELLMEYQDKLLLAYNLGTDTNTNFTKLSNQLTDYYNEWKSAEQNFSNARQAGDYDSLADYTSQIYYSKRNYESLGKIIKDGETLKLSISNYIDILEYIISSIEKGNDLSISQLDLVHKYQNEIYSNASKSYYIENIYF